MRVRTPCVSGYRPHTSGQARVTLDGKDYLLGPLASQKSHEEHRSITAEWLEKRGRFEPKKPEEELPLTVGPIDCGV
jgi:hypothetical protein